MTLAEYINFTIMLIIIAGAFIGTTPYLIILLGTITIVPYFIFSSKMYNHIYNHSNKRIKITGYLSIILPLVIVGYTFYLTKINILKSDETLRLLLIPPNLSLIESICIYLSIYENRYGRTIISDTKNIIKWKLKKH